MDRPLLVIGCSYLIAAAVCICGEPPLCLAALALFLLLLLLFRKSASPARLCAVGGALAAAVCCVFLLLELGPARALIGRKILITGQVEEIVSERTAVVRAETADGAPCRVRFSASFYGEEGLSPFDRVEGTFTFRETSAGQGLSDLAYVRSCRVFLRGTASGPVSVSPADRLTLPQRLQLWREDVAFHIQRFLPRYQGQMAAAMALGRKDLIDGDLQLIFRSAGLSHLLVVSGLHLSFLSLAARRLFMRLIPSKRGAVACAILFTAAAMLFMGSGPSVLRAGWMTVLCLAGELLGREADPLNSLGFALLMVTLPNPFAAAGVGLWLSAASTFSILAFSPRLENSLCRLFAKLPFQSFWRFLSSSASASLCAYLFTLPVSALVFGEISLAAPFANLLAAPLAPLAVAGSFLTALTAPLRLLEPVCRGAAFFTGLAQSALAGIARLISGIPFSSLSVSSGYLCLWAAGVSVLGALALKGGGRRLAAAFVSLSLISLAAGNISYLLVTRDMVFLDCVGGGRETTVIAVQNGRAAIIGEISDPKAIQSLLRRRGVRHLDLLVCLPTRTRETPAFLELTRAYPPALVLAPEGRGAYPEGCDIRPLSPCSVSLWRDSRVSVGEGGAVLLESGQIKALVLPDGCGRLDDAMKNVQLLAVAKSPSAELTADYLVSAGVLYDEDAPRAVSAAYVAERWEPVSFRGRRGRLIPG